MELTEQIKKIAENHLNDESHYIVDVNISSHKGPKKVLVLLDGDKGVTIDDCADLSRAIGAELEDNNIIEDAFRLEVSSPGVDYPLQSVRQYKKNIGRKVKISLKDDKDIVGILKDVTEEKVVLDQEVKKGKNIEYKEVEIPRSDINKTIVQISFK
ncbi:Transcription termination protein NusA [Fulvivirga imtechensis AK7]|uniref:Ribosome maturation factor RimP n=1 Tax=Fulvivirga imtechensis AK7 TaxID=1237149 RepID=L8JX75_9BACT|nr:ribosome maturation factor RimP [Fulvivirga imtechensis]ELR72224.1 Transcription termination protein NusA [Fulvivirga imtechensis AK7]